MEYHDASGSRTVLGGVIERYEHDPFRTGSVALLTNGDKSFYSIVGSKTGVKPSIGTRIDIKLVGNMPVGSDIYKVTRKPGASNTYALARGASCKIIKQEDNTTLIRLPSKEIKRIYNRNTCVEGIVAGDPIVNLLTAGAMRRRGIRPRVRGVAMNCSDHPNGGKTHSSKVKNK
jgi:large subunit ribosomal protein L2